MLPVLLKRLLAEPVALSQHAIAVRELRELQARELRVGVVLIAQLVRFHLASTQPTPG